MNVVRIAILGAALIAGLAAAMLMRGMLGGGTPVSEASLPPSQATVDVLVASRDIAPGVSLDATMVQWQAWPKAAVTDNFFSREAETDIGTVVSGMVVRAPLITGQPVTKTGIARADSAGFLAATIKPGMRAIGVAVTAERSAGGFILPNDRVDIVLTRELPRDDGAREYRSQTIVSDVRVLAIDQTAAPGKDQQSVVGKTATLELTSEQAELVARSAEEGELSLALRALGDSSGTPLTHVAARPLPPVRRTDGTAGGVVVFRYGVARASGEQALLGGSGTAAIGDAGNPAAASRSPAPPASPQ